MKYVPTLHVWSMEGAAKCYRAPKNSWTQSLMPEQSSPFQCMWQCTTCRVCGDGGSTHTTHTNTHTCKHVCAGDVGLAIARALALAGREVGARTRHSIEAACDMLQVHEAFYKSSDMFDEALPMWFSVSGSWPTAPMVPAPSQMECLVMFCNLVQVVILDSNSSFGSETSSRNSEVIHAGLCSTLLAEYDRCPCHLAPALRTKLTRAFVWLYTDWCMLLESSSTTWQMETCCIAC
eukprot:1136697-Pelagomonas_calceolata.AAC.5